MNKRKVTKAICKVFLVLSILSFIGIIGGIENNSMSITKGIVEMIISLLVMAPSFILHCLITNSEKEKYETTKKVNKMSKKAS